MLARNLNGTAATWLLCPSISFCFFFVPSFFFACSSSSGTSPVNYRRQIRRFYPTGRSRGRTGEGGWRLSSNSFGKAPSSVKIKGTAERFTAGRLEEEATCVQSYHLAGTRTYSRSLSSRPPERLHSTAVTARITQIKRGPSLIHFRSLDPPLSLSLSRQETATTRSTPTWRSFKEKPPYLSRCRCFAI